jgi:3'-phosphoadenosine 5'-phosphosulfate sulfotransferase (PAPS reductase)/FAD synthetase
MSFFCADFAVRKYSAENVLLYFNDTKWEHSDLYRFLDDIKRFLQLDIVVDTDGRTPEEVFFDNRFLGNDRVPLCSRILKAQRLQAFYKEGDNLIFGIGFEEKHRALRIRGVYQTIYAKTGKFCTVEFPLVENTVLKPEVDAWFETTGIELPELYRHGFLHNNCSGGCVRQGKKQWKLLLREYPETYRRREQLEKDFRRQFGKDVHFLKDCTLEELRGQVLFAEEVTNKTAFECVGICELMN